MTDDHVLGRAARADYRLEVLETLVTVRSRIHELVDVACTHTEADAVNAIEDLLGCSHDAASQVMTYLRVLTPPVQESLGIEIAELRAQIEEWTTEPTYDPPAAGTGTVFVMRLGELEWTASWQGDEGEEGLEDIEGPAEEVLAWARSRPARQRVVWNWTHDEHVELPPTGVPDVGLPPKRRTR